MTTPLSASAPEVDECGCRPDKGHTHPRLWTQPLRELTPETTDGFRALRFAEALGLSLLPWQRWFLIHALEKRADGTPRFKTVILMVSRQSGKTVLATIIILYWLAILEKRTVVNAAQDLSTAEEVWNSVIEEFRNNALLAGQMAQEPIMAAGKKALWLTDPARVAVPKASNRKAGRGLSADAIYMDEVMTQKTWEAWSALTGATTARPGAITLVTSTAGDAESVVLNHLQDSAREAAREGLDTGVALFEWSGDDEDDPADPQTWRKSEPGYGYTIDRDVLESKYSEMPLPEFRTEYCTQRVASKDAPIDFPSWEATRDPQGDLRHIFARSALHMAVDVSHDGQHVSLIAGGMTDKTRVRVGVIKSWAGKSAVSECEKELKAIIDAARPRDLTWFPGGPGGVLKVAVSRIRSTRVIALRGPDVASACVSVSKQIAARNVLHGGEGEQLLSTQIIGARKRKMGDSWRFDVAGLGSSVDALYGMAAVVQQARLSGGRKPLSVISADPEEGAHA